MESFLSQAQPSLPENPPVLPRRSAGRWALGLCLATLLGGLSLSAVSHSAAEQARASSIRQDALLARIARLEARPGAAKPETPSGYRGVSGGLPASRPANVVPPRPSESAPTAIEVAATMARLFRTARDPGAPTPEEAFRVLESTVEKSIFLVHSTFVYETKDLDGTWVRHSSSTWGTAFVAHGDGYLLTNKHLVAPWKFDGELCALTESGDARILTDTAILTAWPAGTECLDDNRQPILDTGFTTLRGTLHLVAEAPDSFALRAGDDDRTTSVRVHALDNADLAVLRIDSKDFPALPLATLGEERRLSKLTPLMTVGFPRGNGGLEGTKAETSVSTGVLRKMESTLHVTTPIVAGNSGGPLLTADGRVVGVATRIYSETLGIGIRIHHARALLEEAMTVDKIANAANVPPPRSSKKR